MDKNEIICALESLVKNKESDLFVSAPAAATLEIINQPPLNQQIKDIINVFYNNKEKQTNELLLYAHNKLLELEINEGDLFEGVWSIQQIYFLLKRIFGEKSQWPENITEAFNELDQQAYEIPKDSESYAKLCVLQAVAGIPMRDCISAILYVVEKPVIKANIKTTVLNYFLNYTSKSAKLDKLAVAYDNKAPQELINFFYNDQYQKAIIPGSTVQIKSSLDANWDFIFYIKSMGLQPKHFFWQGVYHDVYFLANETAQIIIPIKVNDNIFQTIKNLEKQFISIYFGEDQMLKLKFCRQ